MKKVLMGSGFLLGTLLLSALFVFSTVVPGLTEESPTQLIVVRASDNSLWRATCNELTCSGFTSFPGMFASTPTVVWDEGLKRYIVWGRATDGSIWRATFLPGGTFMNDWVNISGNTPSQIGAAGSIQGYAYNEWAVKGSVDVSTLSSNCDSMTDIAHVDLNPNGKDMYVSVIAAGIYNPSLANKYIRVCLSDTSGGSQSTCNSWNPVIESDSVGPVNEGERRWTLTMGAGALAQNGTYTYYLKACRESGATGTLLWDKVFAIQTQ